MNSETSMNECNQEINTNVDKYSDIMNDINMMCERCQYFDKEYNISTSL